MSNGQLTILVMGLLIIQILQVFVREKTVNQNKLEHSQILQRIYQLESDKETES